MPKNCILTVSNILGKYFEASIASYRFRIALIIFIGRCFSCSTVIELEPRALFGLEKLIAIFNSIDSIGRIKGWSGGNLSISIILPGSKEGAIFSYQFYILLVFLFMK